MQDFLIIAAGTSLCANAGRNRLAVMGTVCFVKDADHVLDELKELLGIDIGETTEDGLFSIDVARYVGACALTRVMLVDETVHAEVKPGQVAKILTEYGYSVKKAAAAP